MKTKFGLMLLPAMLTFALAATLAPAACAERLDDPLNQRQVCVPAPAGIVGWWPGDGNASDIVGGNNGTLSGGVTFTAGKVDKAFSFDGASGEVILPMTPTLSFTATDSFSIDAWLKAPGQALGTQHVAVNLTYACTPEVIQLLVLTNGSIDFSLRDSFGIAVDAISPGPILDNQWHHVAGVRDLANRRDILYLDAVPVVTMTDTMTGTFTNANGQNRIGANGVPCPSDKYYWLGQIDEVEVFRAALSASDVASIFNAGSAGKCRTCVQPPANMVAWLTAEGSGSDRTGLGNDGTLVGGVTFTSGKVGQAFNFDGASGYVNITDSNSLHLSTFTIDAWVNASDITQEHAILIKHTFSPISGNEFAYGLRVNSGGVLEGRITDITGTVSSVVATATISANAFYHVAFTNDGAALRLYIDGQPAGSAATTLTPVTNTEPVVIGAESTTLGIISFWKGLIDEVELYDRALSDAEILAIADAGSAGKCRVPTVVTLSSLEASAAADDRPWLLVGAGALLLAGAAGAGFVLRRRG